jgi:hypothetical protein
LSGNSIAHADGVENEGKSAGIEDAFLDELGGVVQMNVSRYDIDVRTDDGDEGFVKVFLVHAAGAEQTSMRCAGIASLDSVGSHGGIIADFSFSRYGDGSFSLKPDPSGFLLSEDFSSQPDREYTATK